jgi:hypothetical protein
MNEIIYEDVKDSSSQIGFAVNQLTIQIVQCRDLMEQISPKINKRKYSKSSLSEEDFEDSHEEEFDPLMQSVKHR